MERADHTPGQDPLESAEESRLAGLTGFTSDAAKTFLAFHTGMRWLHRDPPAPE